MKALNWTSFMTEYAIRMVGPEDLTACHTIEVRCFPPEEAAWISSLDTRIQTYPEGFLVAESDGKVVGQVNSGSTHKDDISDEEFKQLVGHDPEGRNIVIFSLSVLPEFQKQGIGDKLLGGFIKQARDMGKTKVMLLCKENLVGYYSRHGFENKGPSASNHGSALWNEMSLSL